MAFPPEKFGTDPIREVRLIVSPETTGEDAIRIVHCTLPPHAISEGHVHPDCDEYIYFDIGGVAELDGEEFPVPPMGLVHAKQGVKHECRNTSDTETLILYCVFTPAFKPYGAYPSLIEKTKEYLG